MPEGNLLDEYADGAEFAADVIDAVIAVLNRELRDYNCRVDAYGREQLLRDLALIHVEFGVVEGQTDG